ncbi:MAG: hypothetical protein GF401_13435, partial [Chitinivibrionales bacterium]|nr:hypothetical protein [Chitinivibrionales bacterium]
MGFCFFAGGVLSIHSIYNIDVQQKADLAVECFEKIVAWLPEDGSNHEGPGYWDYGNHWVVRTEALIEHVTGTDYFARNEHFKKDYAFRAYLTTPRWQQTFNIGDGGSGAPGNITPRLYPPLCGFVRSFSSSFRVIVPRPFTPAVTSPQRSLSAYSYGRDVSLVFY